MTTRNTDVNLIIRARNEAGTAITSVAEALKGLLGSAENTGEGVGSLATKIATLDKTYAGLADKTNAVREATSRQASDLHSSNSAIEERRNLIATLTAGLAKMKAQTDKAFVGPRDPGLAQQIKLTQTRINEAERDLRKLTNAFEGNLGAVRAGRSTLLELTTATQAVADAQDAARTKLAETTNAIIAQTEAAKAAARVSPLQQHLDTRVTGVGRSPKSASGSASVFTSEDATLDAQAKALRATLDPLAAIQDRFNTSLARYRILAGAGKISTQELAAAEAHLAAEADRARRSLDGGKGGKLQLFGLKPYELQNLSYQVNDVVTGIASGQKFTQILAQQGGQILQLFPKAGGAIISALTNPGLLAGVAAVGVLAVSIGKAADDAQRLREYTATLGFRADGGQYNAKKLAAQQEGLQRLGATAEDAKAAIRTFLDESIAADKIDDFGRAALATSKILGSDLPSAAKEVATAFTGGYEAVAAFDDKLNFLTSSQREHIRTLFEQGHAEDARTEALGLYEQKSDQVADKQNGKWAKATLHLSGAWDSLRTNLGNTAFIQALIDKFDELAGVLDRIAIGTDGKRTTADADAELADAKAHLDRLQNSLKPGRFGVLLGDSAIADIKRDIAETTALITKLTAERTKLTAAGKPTGDTRSNDPNSAAAKEARDKLKKISDEDELQRLRDAGQVRILSKQEQARRAELAGIIAARNEASAQVAAALTRKAVAEETAKIDRESAARAKTAASDAKRAAQEREQAIKRFDSRIVGAEGGNRKNAAGSGAAGYGQFIPSTYLPLFKQQYPDTQLTDAQILDTRYQEKIATGILSILTRQNAAALDKMGLAVNGANLYALHLFGNSALGRAAVSSRNADVPIDQLIDRLGGKYASQIKSQNSGYLRADKGKGQYRTAGQLVKFLGSRVGDISNEDTTDDAQRQGQLELDRIAADGVKRQEALDLSIKETNEDRAVGAKLLRDEAGLASTALIAQQRKVAIEKAELELRQQVERQNRNLAPGEIPTAVSDAQVAATRETTAALFDASHAAELLRAKLDDAQRPSNELREQIDLLRSQADFLRSIGENKAADAVNKQIDALNPKLDDAIDALIEFYKALTPEERVSLGIVDDAQLDNLIVKLEQAKQSTREWGKVAGVSSKDIAQAFASNAASSFTNFLNKVAAGKNVFKSLGESVLEFASNFASAVAQMILQLLAYAAAVTILRALGVPIPAGGGGGGGSSGGGGILGAIGGLFGGGGGGAEAAGTFHSGGIAGQMGGRSRPMSFDMLAGARRYHGGGIAGLAPDEVGAVLRRGEEVLTEDNPRHRNNQSGSRGDTKPPTVINVFDLDEAFRQMLATPSGSRVFIQHVNDNAGAIKSVLGR